MGEGSDQVMGENGGLESWHSVIVLSRTGSGEPYTPEPAMSSPTDKILNAEKLGLPESQVLAARMLHAAQRHMECATAWRLSRCFDREADELRSASECASRAAIYLTRSV